MRRGLGGHPKPANEVTTDPDGVTPVVPGLDGPDTSKPANEVTTDPEAGNPALAELSIPAESAVSASSAEPYREIIEHALDRGRNARGIWQDLVSDQGFAGSYESVKRFVRRYLERRPPVTLRQVDPLIRELIQYRDLINLRIQEQEPS